MLSVLTIMFMFMQLPCLPLPDADAAAQPEFRIEASTLTPKTGDVVTVSFIVSNPGGQPVSAFDGKITYNNSFFKYYRYVIPDTMKNKVVCFDDEINASAVGFTYADSDGKTIPGGAKDVIFFQVEFIAVNDKANSVNFSARINSCTVGSERVTVLVESITVSAKTTAAAPVVTQPSTTTTTTTAPTAALSSDCSLRELTVAPGTISPAFNNATIGYTVTVENEIANIRIAATPNSDYALVTGTGVKDLAVGVNTFTITVTAQDGTKNSYIIMVTRMEPQESTTTGDVGVVDTTTTSVTTTTSTLYYYTVPTTVPQQTAKSDDSAIKIVGIVFGEIALFFFGFLSGFFIDKNIKRKREEDSAAASAAIYPQQMPPMQMPLPMQMPVMPDTPMRDDFAGYDPNYPGYDQGYGVGYGYTDYEEDDYYN